MRPWLILSGGMIVWAIHFLALYVLASLFEPTAAARAGVGLVTAVCAGADVALLLAGRRAARGGRSDALGGWTGSLGTSMAALSLVAVLWQGLPALLG